jgi:transglutaminase-like putative cysteine protease
MRTARRVRLRAEHAENDLGLRLITLGMAWCAGLALGVATGDGAIAVLLTVVISGGHLVSYRTRTWRSARWQVVLLVPVSVVAMLLVPSLPAAFSGDWLHPMRYLLLLQALTSFYLHSRASLYAAQVLSGVVLLVVSQLAFDSLFLALFAGYYALALVFLAAATRVDATGAGSSRPAIAVAAWPTGIARWGWSTGAAAALVGVALGVFLVLPWGTIAAPGGGGDPLPLTGASADPGASGEGGSSLPLTGPEAGTGVTPGAQGAPVPGESTITPATPETGGQTPAQGQTGTGTGTGAGTEGGSEAPRESFQRPENPTVLLVRSPVQSYWRGTTYSRFDGQTWLPDVVTSFEEPVRTDRFRYTQTFFVRGPLAGPVAGYSALGWQTLGDAPRAGAMDAGDSYRVVSERRDFHPSTLARAPGNDLSVRTPADLLPLRVRELAAQITAGAGGALGRSLAITQYLRSGYEHRDSSTPWEPTQSIESFLFGRAKAGNAFDFAAAQTTLALAAGLEARLVTGYLPGEQDPLSGAYVVPASAAHAWTEVNFWGRSGWVPFDGNPREDGAAQTATSSGAAGAVAGLFSYRVGDDLRRAAGAALVRIATWGGGALVPAGLALMAAGAGLLLWRWRTGRTLAPGYATLEGTGRREAIRAFERLQRVASVTVAPRRAEETVGAYLDRLTARHPDLAPQARWLREALYAAAYRPGPAEPGFLQQVRERMDALAGALAPAPSIAWGTP